MAARAVGRATYQDVLDAPEHLVAELIDGELFLSPRPRPRHSRAALRIGGVLQQTYDIGEGGPGGWWIFIEPEIHLRNDVLVPDLGGWRRERLPEIPQGLAAIDVSPDWVCEVLSPSTGRLDRTRKLPIYAANGISWAWLVDPALRTLEVFHLDDGRWVLSATFGGDNRVAVEPFGDTTLDLSQLWLGPSL